ncbi:thioredoxin family protein [Chitinophaga eiseniae]|uniref:Thioredoxin n=1 Tax=Chitinophaga eiseniae TaxID=634771 RepID=A0A847S8T3_9BACT|nr:DUF255 domain-containing protein [Chitinophaga eiseniae]NLR78201.1 thioredoxin [Chitinophaga eiseniae]
MKLITHIIVLLLVVTNAAGQSVGFDTTSQSWKEVLEHARKAYKPIFVDIYTTWCGPCKWMDNHVFNQTPVASFFNREFINIKINAEEGYGKDFTLQNNIHSYPSFLFFNAAGALVLTGSGARPAASMIQIARQALSNINDNVSLQDMQQKITTGNYSKIAIRDYIKKLSALHQPNATLVETYLETLPADSIYSPEVLQMVSTGYFGRMPLQGKAARVLLHAYAQYPVKSWEFMSPWNIIKSRLLDYTDSAGQQGDATWFNEALAMSDSLNPFPFSRNRERLYLSCRYYLAAEDSNRFITAANEFADKYIMNVNIDSLTIYDQLALGDALKVKFGRSSSTKQAPSAFKKGFLYETRLINEELFEIIYGYKQHFNTMLKLNASLIRQWIDKSILLYRSNTVYINESFIEQQKKAFYQLLN